jgi:TldD protein
MPDNWNRAIDEALAQALVNLRKRPGAGGVMTVLLGPGWPGVLLHEAVGHGLEGDFNRKGTSAFSPAASASALARRASLWSTTARCRIGAARSRSMTKARRRSETVLIEDGILKGYHAGPAQCPADGRGRHRQRPPRKLCPCADAAHDQHLHARRQRRSRRTAYRVKNGIFAKSFGGGQVDITNGKFVFSCTEAYRVENGGKLGAPIKGATLIGDGPSVLTRADRHRQRHGARRRRIGCGKGGQACLSGVGQPTLLIGGLTVGGTRSARSSAPAACHPALMRKPRWN